MQATYVDSQARVYPNLRVDGHTLVAKPGQTYELDTVPNDGRWTTQKVATPDQPAGLVVDPPAAPVPPLAVSEAVQLTGDELAERGLDRGPLPPA